MQVGMRFWRGLTGDSDWEMEEQNGTLTGRATWKNAQSSPSEVMPNLRAMQAIVSKRKRYTGIDNVLKL